MGVLRFDNFHVGEITAPSDTEIPMSAATLAQNVEYDRFGKIRKQKGRLIKFAGPSGVTWKSHIEIEFTKPSRQQVIIMHGQDGSGREELWWRPYWDGSQWVDDWQELTEFEGPLTADSGTGVSDIVDAALSNSTDDYYNGWVVMNVTRQTVVEVYDYDGGTKTLTLREDVGSQTTADAYFIYRFPLILPIETGTADANTSTTELVDSTLRSNVDEFYTGWTLVNTTRGETRTITAYDGSTKTLTHAAISGQTSGDSYYLYRTDHDIGITSSEVARFYPRENAVEIALGNSAQYPLLAPLWFGYISERYYFTKGTGSDDTTFDGFLLVPNVMDRPDSSIINVSDNGSGTLADDTYYFRVSYLYDGYQESSLSDFTSLNPSSTNRIDINLDIPLYITDSGNKASAFDATFNKRITHVRVYIAKGSTAHNRNDYFLYLEAPINSAVDVNVKIFLFSVSFDAWQKSGDLYQFVNNRVLDDDVYNGTTYNEANGIIFGKFARWDFNQGHDSQSVDCNFKYKVTIGEVHYKAPIFTDQQRNAFVGYSIESNGAGVPVDDVIPHQNFLNLAQRGIVEITGLAEAAGFLIIFTPRRIFRYAPGRIFLEHVVQRGCIAPDSIKEVDGIVYFADFDDFYAFDGNNMRKLMFNKILDQWDDISDSDKESTIAGYNKKTHSIWLKAGSTIFIYDILFDAWRKHSTAITPVWFGEGIDGDLFVADSDELWELESSTSQEAITIDWRSKVVDLAKEIDGRFIPIKGVFKRMILKHSGDNNVVVEVFDPSYSNNYPKIKRKFFPKGVSQEKSVDVAFEAQQVKVKITDENDGTAIYSHDIDYLMLEFDEVTP